MAKVRRKIGNRKKICKKIAFSASKKKHISRIYYIFAHIEERLALFIIIAAFLEDSRAWCLHCHLQIRVCHLEKEDEHERFVFIMCFPNFEVRKALYRVVVPETQNHRPGCGTRWKGQGIDRLERSGWVFVKHKASHLPSKRPDLRHTGWRPRSS